MVITFHGCRVRMGILDLLKSKARVEAVFEGGKTNQSLYCCFLYSLLYTTKSPAAHNYCNLLFTLCKCPIIDCSSIFPCDI